MDAADQLIERVKQVTLRRALQRESARATRSVARLNQLVERIEDDHLRHQVTLELAARLKEPAAPREKAVARDVAGLLDEHRALEEDKRALDAAVDSRMEAATPKRRRRKLKPGEAAVLMALERLPRLHEMAGTDPPTQANIARLSGFSRPHVSQQLTGLIEMKLVKVTGKAGRSQLYELTTAGRAWVNRFYSAE